MPRVSMFGSTAVRAWGRGGGKLVASVNNPTVSGSGAGSTETTGSVTASYSGIAGTPTYAWERVSGDASITCSNAALATVTFSAAGLANSEERDAVWRCKITVGGQQAYTPNVSIALARDAAPIPITVTITPADVTQTRAGAGGVVFSYTASADHSYDGWGWGVGGDGGWSIIHQDATSLDLLYTLSAAPQAKDGSVALTVTDSGTGRSGTGGALWHARST